MTCLHTTALQTACVSWFAYSIRMQLLSCSRILPSQKQQPRRSGSTITWKMGGCITILGPLVGTKHDVSLDETVQPRGCARYSRHSVLLRRSVAVVNDSNARSESADGYPRTYQFSPHLSAGPASDHRFDISGIVQKVHRRALMLMANPYHHVALRKDHGETHNPRQRATPVVMKAKAALRCF